MSEKGNGKGSNHVCDLSWYDLSSFLFHLQLHLTLSTVDGCHAPSWLNPGELSHTHIHLTMDHDLTQLNAPPCVGNTEYSLTWTSLTLTDISRQAGMAC